MNEQNSQSPDEGRLIDYLLNESSPEERAEIERLCSQHADWNKAKTALESTFGLIEDACKQPATEVEGEMQLDANRRQELETLRSDKLSETMEQSEQETETEERPVAFKPAVWAPLAAAACAAFLVWASDSTDRENPEEQLAAADLEPAQKVEENENLPETRNENATLLPADREVAKKEDAIAAPSPSVAIKEPRLQENQDAPAVDDPVVPNELIANLGRRASQGADEVLGKRAFQDVDSLNQSFEKDAEKISLADAFAQPAPESASGNLSRDSGLAALRERSGVVAAGGSFNPVPVPSAPTIASAEIMLSANQTIVEASKTSGKKEEGATFAGFVAESTTDLEIKDETKSLARIKEGSEGLDLAYKRPTSGLRTEARAEGKRVAEESAHSKKSSETPPSLNARLSPKRSKPSSWTDLIRNPSSSFLFNQNGQALGEVAITQSEGKTSVIRRMGEIRQGKRFLLTPGQFELRMTDQLGSVVILSGELKRRAEFKDIDSKEAESSSNGSRDGDYEFVAKEAWWLDQNEVRQALPVNELAR